VRKKCGVGIIQKKKKLKSEKLFEGKDLENYFQKSRMMNGEMSRGPKVAMHKAHHARVLSSGLILEEYFFSYFSPQRSGPRISARFVDAIIFMRPSLLKPSS